MPRNEHEYKNHPVSMYSAYSPSVHAHDPRHVSAMSAYSVPAVELDAVGTGRESVQELPGEAGYR